MSPSEYEIKESEYEQKFRQWEQLMLLSELPPTHPLKRAALAEKRKRQMDTLFGIAILGLIFAIAWAAWCRV